MDRETSQRIEVLKQNVEKYETLYLNSLRDLYKETKNEEILKKLKKVEETILIEEIYENESTVDHQQIDEIRVLTLINCCFWVGGKVTKDHISRITKFKKKMKK
jgi:polyribonucleotide nucleotidyltransferase